MKLRIWIKIGFQQRDRQDSQNLNDDTFQRLPITSAQSIIGAENYPESGIFGNYDDDEYSHCNGQFKEASRALTKDYILQRYISLDNF